MKTPVDESTVMISIDSWHFKFIRLFNPNYNPYNTCEYVRQFLYSAMACVICIAINLLLSFAITMGLIVISIFMWHSSISIEAFSLAVQSLPPVVGILFLFFITFSVLALIITLFIGGGVLINQAYYKNLRHQVHSSSTYKIASAWHDKICLRILVDNNKEV